MGDTMGDLYSKDVSDYSGAHRARVPKVDEKREGS